MERYNILDRIRGAAVISMIFYHAVWDAANVLGIYMSWFDSRIGYVWEQSICWTFILLSGFCFRLGTRRLRRGLTVFAAGLLVTAVTAVFMPQNIVICGILSLLGMCMIAAVPLDKAAVRLNPVIGLVIFGALFFVFRNVNNGNLGFEGFVIAWLPREMLYRNTLTACLGFPPYTFYSGDYFPFLPWVFLFMTGYFLYGIFKERGLLNKLRGKRSGFLGFVGRHALIIYLAHQPALFALAGAAELILK